MYNLKYIFMSVLPGRKGSGCLSLSAVSMSDARSVATYHYIYIYIYSTHTCVHTCIRLKAYI